MFRIAVVDNIPSIVELNANLDWFEERNIRLFRLVTSDEARPLYASLGFTATKEMGMFR